MTLEARIEALLARASGLTLEEEHELHELVNVRESVTLDESWTLEDELNHRKALSGKAINDLPDDAFAYIEAGGEKDDEGKTTPRSLRHYPVHDEAHARNAYARASAQIQSSGPGKAIAQKAMPKIKTALKKFGVPTDDKKTATRTACPACGSDNPAKAVGSEMRCPDCQGYRGDAALHGGNFDDGTMTGGGSVNPAGVPDGTGSVSSKEPSEGRSCNCNDDKRDLRFKSVDDLSQALAEFIAERADWVVLGEDGSDGVDASFGDANTPPHPSDDNDESDDQRQDPDVDLAGDIGDIDDGSNEEPAGPSRDGDDGSSPADEDFGDAGTPPAPGNDDDQGEDQREDPDVDEGDSVDDGEPYPDAQASDRGEKRRAKPRRSSTPAPKPEHRARVSEIKVRTSTTGDGPELEGRAIVYSAPYTVYDAFGAFTESMDPSVCDRVLASGNLDCRGLINHEGIPLCRTTSRTLELVNTAKGLDSIWHLSASSTLAADLADAIARRDITQMSVGFRVAEDEWDDDYMNRTIYSFADLLDVSSVTYPASPTTSIDVAKRMLFSLPGEAREGVARAYSMVCDVRAGSQLDRDCSNFVLRALEMLYSVDDPRVPLVRVREAWKIARDVRSGKKLSGANAGFIAAALESLHRADDVDLADIARSLESVDGALDDAMSALSEVSGLPNPDDDDDDDAADPGEKIRKRELELEEAAERRRRAAKAQSARLRVRTRPTTRP